MSVKHPNKILADRMARRAAEQRQAEEQAKDEAKTAGRKYIRPKPKDGSKSSFKPTEVPEIPKGMPFIMLSQAALEALLERPPSRRGFQMLVRPSPAHAVRVYRCRSPRRSDPDSTTIRVYNFSLLVLPIAVFGLDHRVPTPSGRSHWARHNLVGSRGSDARGHGWPAHTARGADWRRMGCAVRCAHDLGVLVPLSLAVPGTVFVLMALCVPAIRKRQPEKRSAPERHYEVRSPA